MSNLTVRPYSGVPRPSPHPYSTDTTRASSMLIAQGYYWPDEKSDHERGTPVGDFQTATGFPNECHNSLATSLGPNGAFPPGGALAQKSPTMSIFEPLSHIADTPASTSNYPSPSLTFMQHHQPSPADYPATQSPYSVEDPPTPHDGCYPSSFPHATYRKNPYMDFSYPYGDRQGYHLQPTSYDRRSSITSTVSSDHAYGYFAHDALDTPYTHSTRSSSAQELIPPSTLPNAISSSFNGMCNIEGDASPLHTTRSLQVLPTQDQFQGSPPTSSESPRLSGVGSAESVRRRVDIMLQQQRQQNVQVERVLSRASLRDSTQILPDGRRGKQGAISTAVVGGGVPVTWAKAPSSTDPTVPDYKSAYKRVKRQRAYYKQAALSLLEELYMLRGEPRKADEHAAKGVSFDIKRAQGELENQKSLIEANKELCGLRDPNPANEPPQPRTRAYGLGKSYCPGDQSEDVPLSAAPITTYGRYHS
ncbi:hypothetical protein CTheo_2310 [Ceratobasidium theobromae]|uniref:Uncharacterized protein n=1 Tax=Ceratobasidium theobromae TaxID=1582974 RepID=A0A5N5QRH8_9AGAM|nr:hypothetical protein CTheo_2310 [Ceratobasidium theobromae]